MSEGSNHRRTGMILVWLGHALSWTLVYHIVGPHAHTCPQGDDGPFAFSMVVGPVTLVVACVLVLMGARLGAQPRWPILLHVVVAGFAGYFLVDDLVTTTVRGHHLCGPGFDAHSVPAWHRAFAPAQLTAWIGFVAASLWSALTLRFS